MGKSKQHQRTKGNLQASSSSRAAEMLENLGAQGFSGGLTGYVPVTSAFDDPDSSVDPDIRMVMKKLTKKDTTTKIKALQELAILCKDKDISAVQTMLSFWPRLYQKLSIDHERKVREACQLTMKELVMKLGREIAPQLKSLIGPWLVAQCDPYNQASGAAITAFSTAFTPVKQKQTMIFCKKEIVNHVEDNLLKQTADTLSDKKITSPEDMQSKYERTVACSLGAWKLFMTSNPPQADIVDRYAQILKSSNFWKFHVHQSSLIRANFYSMLSALCQVHPNLMKEQFAEKSCTSTLYKIDETSPLVTPQLWDAVLYVLTTIDDWHKHVNLQKGFLPKLWKLLKSGGDPSTEIIYPNLLPLLSKLPSELTSNNASFVEQFFETLKLSLKLETLSRSQENLNAVVSCFMECARYCIRFYSQTQAMNITDMMNEILIASFTEESEVLSNSPLYIDIYTFITYTCKLYEENQEKDAMINTLYNSCWNVIHSNILDLLFNDGSVQVKPYVFDRIVKFIDCLCQKVTNTDQKLEVKKENIGSGNKTFLDKLDSLVKEFASKCYISLQKQFSSGYMKLFCCLVKNCRNEAILNELLQMIFVDESNEGNIYAKFLRKVFLSFLCTDYLLQAAEVSSDTSYFDSLAEVLIDFTMRSGNVNEFLDSILKEVMSEPALLTAFINQLVSHDSEELHSYMSQPDFGNAIFTIAKEFITENSHEDDCLEHETSEKSTPEEVKLQKQQAACFDMLRKVLMHNRNGIPSLDTKYLDMITEHVILKLQTSLDIQNPLIYGMFQKRVQFLCHFALMLFDITQDKLFTTSIGDVAIAILQLHAKTYFAHEESLCKNELQSAWTVAFQYLKHLPSGIDAWCNKFTDMLKTIVLSNPFITYGHVQHVYDITLKMFEFYPSEENKQRICKTILDFTPVYKAGNYWEMYLADSEPLVIPCITASVKADYTYLNTDLATQLFRTKLINSLNFNIGEDGNAILEENCQLCLALADYRMKLNLLNVVQDPNLERLLVIEVENFVNELFNDGGQLLNIARHLLQLTVNDNTGGFYSEGLKLAIDSFTGHHPSYEEVIRDIMEPIENYCNTVEVKYCKVALIMVDLLEVDNLCNLAEILSATVSSLPQDSQEAVEGYTLQMAMVTKVLRKLGTLARTDTISTVMSNIAYLVATIIEWESKYEELFAGIPVNIGFAVHVLRYLTAVIDICPQYLTSSQWDFILCKLMWWLQEITDISVTDTHTLKLYTAVCNCMESLADCTDSKVIDLYPLNIATEWREFFSPQGSKAVLDILFQVSKFKETESSVEAGQQKCGYVSITPHCLQALCEATIYVSEENLLDSIPSYYIPEESSNTHSMLNLLSRGLTRFNSSMPLLSQSYCQSVTIEAGPYILKQDQILQATSYKLIQKLIPNIWTMEEEKVKKAEMSMKENDSLSSQLVSEDEEKITPPKELLDIVEKRSEAMVIWLDTNKVNIGDFWICCDDREQFELMSFFFGWLLILDLFRVASPMARASYAAYFRDSKAIDILLQVAFCIMPSNPITSSTAVKPSSKMSLGAISKVTGKNYFENSFIVHFKGNWSIQDVQHCACTVYYTVLEELPVLARQWWNNLDRHLTDVVDKYTSKFVTPILCDKQIGDVKPSVFQDSNVQVKTRPVAREVIAVYSVDEASLEVVVSLPANHPLGAVKVEQGKKIGIAQSQWRNWMLQLTTFLQHQNGSIIKGLQLWKKNVDKKFEGVEECYVCYSVIHGTTCQLPKLQCKTCKKKFHSSCLYKWFSTSNNSTCPLCRNLF